MSINWQIYYADGSVFSNLDGSWEDAPGHGALIALIPDPDVKWVAIGNADFLVQDKEGAIVSVSESGFEDYMVNVHRIVKRGRMISRQDWLRVAKVAYGDRDFAVKHGYLKLKDGLSK